MTNAQQKMLDKFKGLKGKDFAKQYMEDQVSAHKDAVSLFQRYGQGGDNGALKGWANKTLPTLQHHLDMAQGIYKNMARSPHTGTRETGTEKDAAPQVFLALVAEG